jgi:hypothetical protein
MSTDLNPDVWIKDLVHIEQKYGLLTFVRSREDVEEKISRELTDAEWDAVRSTVAWRKGSDDEFINSLLNEIVWEAITQANISTEEV